jgi:hypothetical protein
MEPRTRNIRRLYQGGPAVVVADTDGNPMTDLDDYFEDGDEVFLNNLESEKHISDEDIKIKAIKQAIDIAKIQDAVTTEDVLKIASQLAIFIKNRKLPGN